MTSSVTETPSDSMKMTSSTSNNNITGSSSSSSSSEGGMEGSESTSASMQRQVELLFIKRQSGVEESGAVNFAPRQVGLFIYF